MKTCQVCGTQFQSKRADAKFCKAACRQEAYRQRNGIAAPPFLSKPARKPTAAIDGLTAIAASLSKPKAPRPAISGPANPRYELLQSQLRTLSSARAQLASWRQQHVARMAVAKPGTLGAVGGGLLGAVLTDDRTPKGRPKYSEGERLAAMLFLGWVGYQVADRPADPVQQSQAAAALQDVDTRISNLDVQIQALRNELDSTPATLAQPAAAVAALPQVLLPARRERKPAGIMSAMELAKMEFQTLGFDGPFRDLVGDPPQGFYMMVTGAPKMGKSNLCMQFAEYMTKWGDVLYVAAEENLGYTLQQKVKANKALNEHLKFSGPLTSAELVRLASSGAFKTIILDSVNRMNLEADDAEKLKATGVNLCTILQSTKDGSFRGSREWEHNADVIVEIKEKGIATSRGRFAAEGNYRIFANDEFNEVRQVERKQKQLY